MMKTEDNSTTKMTTIIIAAIAPALSPSLVGAPLPPSTVLSALDCGCDKGLVCVPVGESWVSVSTVQERKKQ